jgi:hypothetical protein
MMYDSELGRKYTWKLNFHLVGVYYVYFIY